MIIRNFRKEYKIFTLRRKILLSKTFQLNYIKENSSCVICKEDSSVQTMLMIRGLSDIVQRKLKRIIESEIFLKSALHLTIYVKYL